MATILVVDDRPVNRKFLVKLLGYFDYRLQVAADGAEALERVRAEPPDLIIADILMPTMDGYEFVRQLRATEAGAAIPVIFYTAHYLAREAESLARACGVSHILMKPCKPEVVVSTVREALGLPPAPTAPLPEEAFDREHRRLLTDKLSQKTEELRAINHRLEAMVELGQELTSERDPLRLLNRFCHAARDIIGAKYAAVGILAAGGQALQHFLTSGIQAELAARLGSPPTLQGMFGRLLEERQPLRVRDLGADPQAAGFLPDHPPMRSFLSAPVATPAQLYGLLYLTDKLGAEEFSEADERLVVTLAAQVAVAYENALRHAEIQRRTAELEREVSERRQVEAALQESEARLAAIVKSAMDAIIAVDAEQRIVLFNTAAEQMFRCPAAQALGQPVSRFIPERFRRAHEEHIREFGRTKATKRLMGAPGAIFGLRADGEEFPAESSISQVEAAGQKLYTVILRDITERQQAEQQIRALNAELEQRVRERTRELEATNQELEGFSYSVSHDLRAPLRAINGFAQILSEDYASCLDAEGRRLLNVICANARQMGQLIDDLLAFSRIGRKEVEKTAVDLTHLARSVVDELRKLEPGREVAITIEPLPPAQADRALLRQVLVNLVANALKFTRPTPRPAVAIGWRQEGEETVYYVKDNGVGFNMRYANKLFGVFQRLHSAQEFEGTGVGLALVQRIIHRHGGRVWAEGAEGCGATFYFILPKGEG